MKAMPSQLLRLSGQLSPELTPSRQRLWWALVVTLVVVFYIWGVFADFPFNLILWGMAVLCLAIFIYMIYRQVRPPKKIEFLEIRRLIACDKCGVETEGPFEPGDHIFRDIGPCPRCDGRLYIKAVYGIDEKTPMKRQQPLPESSSPEDER
jgi:hypothetical protein